MRNPFWKPTPVPSTKVQDDELVWDVEVAARNLEVAVNTARNMGLKVTLGMSGTYNQKAELHVEVVIEKVLVGG